MEDNHFERYKNTLWIVKSKRGRLSPLPNVYSMEAVTTITKKLLHGLTWNKILITLEQREMHVVVDKESEDLIDKEGMSVLQKNPSVFHNSIATVKNVAKEWISQLQQVYIQDLRTITDRELLQMCLTYREYYKKVYGHYFTILILEKPLTDFLQNILKKRIDEKKSAEAFTTLTFTIDAMHPKNEERDRLQLALTVLKNSAYTQLFEKEASEIEKELLQFPLLNDAIDAHTQKHFWLTRDYEDAVLTKNDFIQRIKEALTQGNVEERAIEALLAREKNKEKIEMLERELKLTEEEKNRFSIMRAGIYLKELRKKIVSQSLFYFDHVLEEICKRTGLELRLARMLLSEDLEAVLIEKKVYTSILEERFKRSVYVVEDGVHHLFVGKDADALFDVVVKVDRDVKEMKGLSGSAGIARGPARIIKHPSEFHKIQKGDVMVTVQAVPSFIEPLRKSVALVADGGTGITSHPATLAREVGIPCVFQTKVATEVIQDGDVVEVDGNTGIVKILERKGASRQNENSKVIESSEYWIKIAEDHHASLFPPYFWLLAAYFETPKITGIRVQGSALEMMNHSFNFILKMPHWRDAGAALTEKAVHDKKLFPKIRRLSIQYVDALVSFAEALSLREFSKATNKQLNQWYQQLCQSLLRKWSLGVTHVMFDFDYTHVTDRLVAILEKKTDHVQEMLSVLTTPQEESALKKEEIAFLKIVAFARKLGVDHPRVQLLLKKHWKSYLWIQHSWEGKALQIEFFEQRLQQMIFEKVHAGDEIKTITMKRKNLLKKQKALEKKLHLTLDEKRLFAMGRGIVFLKAYRKELLFKVLCLVDPFLEEVAKRCQLTVAELRFLLYHEVEEALLKGKDYRSITRERMKHSVFVVEDGTQRMLVGTEAKTFSNNVRHETADPHQKVLKGMCAQPGVVEGIVKHISTPEDMVKFNTGDILVSAATNPMIVPAMERAGAIITDEGGLTCHASIVSRELGVPCVIGTKIATKLLQEGERVRVDATKGVITRVDY